MKYYKILNINSEVIQTGTSTGDLIDIMIQITEEEYNQLNEV